MPISQRATIFRPFAAFSGHSITEVEATRLTDQKIELDEDTRTEVDRQPSILLEHISEQLEVTVTWTTMLCISRWIRSWKWNRRR